jgi:hypothetical protein
MGGFFATVDDMLDHGGQTALDALSFIPGVGQAAGAAQALYHGAHAVSDIADGNYRGAVTQGFEWASHGLGTAFHHAAMPIHAAEFLWDGYAGSQNIKGGHLPMAGAAIPEAATSLILDGHLPHWHGAPEQPEDDPNTPLIQPKTINPPDLPLPGGVKPDVPRDGGVDMMMPGVNPFEMYNG